MTVSDLTVTDSYAFEGFTSCRYSQLSKERYTAPELLFLPALDINCSTSVSIVDLAIASFESFMLSEEMSEQDLKGYQSNLAHNIVLTGAASKLTGLTKRLQVSNKLIVCLYEVLMT
jgi:Actin